MNKLLAIAFTLAFTQAAFSQESRELLESQQPSASLENRLASVDVGLLGVWLGYETKISDLLTLNSQLGIEGGFYGGGGEFNYAFTPTINTEPRFYYNFNRRVARQKKTRYNSANFVGLTATYVPGIFTVTNEDFNADMALNLIPKWGLRRAIGKNVKFDFSAGYGVTFREGTTYGLFGIDLSFGYLFYQRK